MMRAQSSTEFLERIDTTDELPANFDVTANPILTKHYFGLKPFSPFAHVEVDVVADLRRQRQIEHLHLLGPRAVGELLREVAEDDDLDRALEAYGRLTPDLLKALGGDEFSPVPIHKVEQR